MQQNFLAQPDSTTDKYMAKNCSILPAAFKGICRHFLSKSFYVSPTLHRAFFMIQNLRFRPIWTGWVSISDQGAW